MKEARQKVFRTQRRSLVLGEKTHLVGILNLTPDSFSDGGDYNDFQKAEAQFEKMLAEGATIIDIGGESTRPNHLPISVDEEINRVLPFLQRIRPKTDCLISIDTSKSKVAQECLEAGADIINDVWGGQRDPEMLSVIADYDAACILMHNADGTSLGRGIQCLVLRHFYKRLSMRTSGGRTRIGDYPRPRFRLWQKFFG